MASGTIKNLNPYAYYNQSTATGNTNNETNFTVSGNGFVYVSASIYTDITSDTGTVRTVISAGGRTYAQNQGTIDYARGYVIGSNASCMVPVSNGNVIKIILQCTKNGTKTMVDNLMCFGCTVTAQ